jgi:PAS domain S-box-containing protein
MRRYAERLFLDARIGMTLVDGDGRYLRANPAFCRLLGYREDELLGRRFSELTHPDERDAQLELLEALRSGAVEGVETEMRYLARDGRAIWALVNVAPTSDRSALIVQVQDISERKRAELAVVEERNLLRALLETTTDQVYFKDLASRFIRVSRAQAAKLGFSGPDEAIGKTDFDVFSSEHAREAFHDEQHIIETGEPIIDIEERETWTDAREAWVSTSKFPLRDEHGELMGTFGISRDITRRKRIEEGLRESEGRWRTLLANAQELIVVLDGDGRVAYCSPSIERWLGYAAEELVALPSHPDDEAALRQRPWRRHALHHHAAAAAARRQSGLSAARGRTRPPRALASPPWLARPPASSAPPAAPSPPSGAASARTAAPGTRSPRRRAPRRRGRPPQPSSRPRCRTWRRSATRACRPASASSTACSAAASSPARSS